MSRWYANGLACLQQVPAPQQLPSMLTRALPQQKLATPQGRSNGKRFLPALQASQGLGLALLMHPTALHRLDDVVQLIAQRLGKLQPFGFDRRIELRLAMQQP